MKEINKAIEMISVSSKDGSIKPIRFRLATENEEMQVIKIKKIHQMDQIKIGNNLARKFTCTIVLNERERVCEITYTLVNQMWHLFKL